MATIDLNMIDEYRRLAAELDAAPFKLKGAIRKAFQKMHGVSQHTVYRELKNIGWSSERSTRTDAGTTSVDEETLVELESLRRLSVRANGKSTMPTSVAASVLEANGRDINVSNSRLNQLFVQRKSTNKQQKQLSAHQKLRSLHPNHVHQVDPSYCLLYYAPSGDQLVQRFVDESDFYENKPDNLDSIKHLKCWRYVLTDHYSGAIIVKYFQSRGETTAILWEFLLYCWQTIDSRPFRGVPKIMVWDRGSANTASSIKNALRILQVEQIAHQAKNPRAKGQVESSNNIVECHFESRLRFEPVNSVEELNQAAEAWYNAWNANLITRQDTRLKRVGMTQPMARYQLWQTILRNPTHLRELPPLDICHMLLRARPQTRKVDGHLEISFKHPKAPTTMQYSLRDVAHVCVGDKVEVSALFYGSCQVRVTVKDYVGEESHHIIEPREYDEAGFAVDAPVWGQEIKGMRDTEIEKRNKAADQAAYPNMDEEAIKKAKAKQVTPFEGQLDAHSHLKNIQQPTFMKREGSAIDLPNEYKSASRKPLTQLKAKKLIAEKLNRSLSVWESDFIAGYSDVFEEDIPDIIEKLLAGESSPLKLVQ